LWAFFGSWQFLGQAELSHLRRKGERRIPRKMVAKEANKTAESAYSEIVMVPYKQLSRLAA